MTRSKNLALAFYLGAALAGAAIGISVDRLVVQPRTRWWDQRVMRARLFDQLKLTAEQRDAAGKIFDDRNRKQDAILAPVKPSLDSASVDARARLSQLLTSEQKAIYDQMQREREQAQRAEKK
jgi:Spy/CpxP family protein refolding chaperone